jgi:hypothetical protein
MEGQHFDVLKTDNSPTFDISVRTKIVVQCYGCLPHTSSTFFIINTAHCTLAAISLSVLGLPCGPPNRSSAVGMCSEVRIAAMMPITRFRPSSTTAVYTFRRLFASEIVVG